MIRRAYAVQAIADDDPTDGLSDAYLNLVKKLYNGDLNPDRIDIPTTLETAHDLMNQVFKGFGGNFSKFEYDTPDYDKLAHLERNVYSFSGAKNWQMLRDLTDAVKNTATEKEFLEKAWQIGGEYNKLWRQTERITAIHGAQNASREVGFEKHPEAILEFRVADLERACPICAPLDGLRMRANDPARSRFSPMLHWRCGCQWLETNETETNPDHKAHQIPPGNIKPTMFRGNLGKEGLVFPEGSPYFIDCPKGIIKQALKLIPKKKRT